jgi:hypothetical protein
VNNERSHRLVKPHSPLARVLSFLLLGFIVCGTTVEAAHTHGALTAAKSSVTASNFSTPDSEVKTATNLVGCGDCLICQLHQQFSTSVIAAPPSIIPSSLASLHFNTTATAVHSPPAAPRSGRAPPKAIL